MSERCRHRRCWVIASWLWCYECGAIRQMVHTGTNHLIPKHRWIKPVGKGGENPALSGFFRGKE